ncbi:type VI secretion protein [Pseudomonas capsici]|uniref:type VI secretion protein n=1 Tax=Pseudomonas capsici TaxID=2810614 RepID=UPI0021F0E286|nr:type VI secretion protein [Pseudomonas capsici]MCV4286384.1 type VI secretion protein [Pseudomonas capsici]
MIVKQFKYRQWIAVLLAVFTLTGCSFLDPKISIDSLVLDVALRANDDSPVAVDFISVNDPDLLNKLSGLTASQWFSEREQYRRDYRQLMAIWGMELVPGQLIESGTFPLDGKPSMGLLVFANYNTPGAHRLRLDGQRRIWLKFDSREMTLFDENTH